MSDEHLTLFVTLMLEIVHINILHNTKKQSFALSKITKLLG